MSEQTASTQDAERWLGALIASMTRGALAQGAAPPFGLARARSALEDLLGAAAAPPLSPTGPPVEAPPVPALLEPEPPPPPPPPPAPDLDARDSVSFAEPPGGRFTERTAEPGVFDMELTEFSDFDESLAAEDSLDLDIEGLALDLDDEDIVESLDLDAELDATVDLSQASSLDEGLFKADDQARGGRHDRDVRSSVKKLFGK